MENNFEILNIFPLPVARLEVPLEYAKVVSYFDSQSMLNLNEDFQKSYGQRSEDSYLLDKPPFLELKKFILDKALQYGSNILKHDYTSYKLTQSWISHKYPGQSHTIHTHPNSLISGVFYYGNFESNTPSINFHKTHASFTNILFPRYKLSPLGENPDEEIYSLNPTAGTLLLFPSYLPHSVPENTTNKVRKSLAFNIVPTEGFGSEEDLTELKFN